MPVSCRFRASPSKHRWVEFENARQSDVLLEVGLESIECPADLKRQTGMKNTAHVAMKRFLEEFANLEFLMCPAPVSLNVGS